MKLNELANNIGLEVEVSGEIVKIHPQRTGDSQYKVGEKYTVQNIVIKDETGEATIALWDKSECTDAMMGRNLIVYGGKISKDSYGIKVSAGKSSKVRLGVEEKAQEPLIANEDKKLQILQKIEELKSLIASW